MTGEHAIEPAVVERQSQRVALHERPVGDAVAGDREHLLALVEPGDLAAEVLGQKARPARDVERAAGFQRGHRLGKRGDRLIPSGPVALGEQPLPEVPLVVLGRARVVVLLHP